MTKSNKSSVITEQLILPATSPVRKFQEAQAQASAPTSSLPSLKVSDRDTVFAAVGTIHPGRLLAIIRQNEQGYIREMQNLYMEILERDPHIASVMQTREMAVSGMEWQITPASDDDLDIAVAIFVSDMFKGIEESFDDMVEHSLTAIGRGFAVTEINWNIDTDVRIESFTTLQQQRFTFADSHDPRLITDNNFVTGIELPPNKFVEHKQRSSSGLTNRAGVLRTVAFLYMLKGFSLADWGIYLEVFGMPIRLGKYPVAATPEDKEVLKQALILLGTDAAAVIPDGMEVEMLTRKFASTGQEYQTFMDWCDNQISKVVLGQTLTTENTGSTGSMAMAKVHDKVKQSLTVADVKALEKTLRRDTIRPITLFNFGPTVIPPKVKFAHRSEPDLTLEVEKDVKLFMPAPDGLNLPVAKSHVYEKYGVPVPEDDENLLEVGASPVLSDSQVPDGEFKAPRNSLERLQQFRAILAVQQS